jgi:hypothetical protein
MRRVPSVGHHKASFPDDTINSLSLSRRLGFMVAAKKEKMKTTPQGIDKSSAAVAALRSLIGNPQEC